MCSELYLQAADLAGRQPRFVLSRLRKMLLSREPAEKNNRLSRQENCGLITEKSIIYSFRHNYMYASYSPQPYSPSLVGAIMISLCLCDGPIIRVSGD